MVKREVYLVRLRQLTDFEHWKDFYYHITHLQKKE